jgi:hypothetical protein
MIIHSPIFSGSINQAESAYANLSGSFTGSFKGIGDFEGLEADSVAYENVTGKPTLVSGSSQVAYPSLSNIPSGIVSSSSQVVYTSISSIPAGIVSGSSQILGGSGIFSGSSQVVDILTSLNTYTASNDTTNTTQNGRLTSLETKTGSLDSDNTAQNSRLTNIEGFTSSIDTTIKTKLNTDTVVSGSSQILTLVSIDEDEMTSNSDTKLPTQQSVKSYVDSKVAGLVDSAPGTLDTLNELAAALGDDPNFATTVSTTIGGKVSQSLQIISGDGLTGGGNLTANRTLAVGGTTDRISISADAVDIASTYVGQTSITTLGTIGTGTWNGSVITSAFLDADTAHLTETQTFSGAKTFSAVTTISNSTASTTTATGALLVTGGVGIGGALNVGGDVVAFASSDKRLKDNIKNIENPIQKVQKLNGVTWDWNSNADELQQSLPNVGVIAQEVEEVLPQLVHNRDNGFKGVDYAKLTGLLIEAIKEQQKQIDELKSKLQ